MTVELTRRLLALGVPTPEIEAALFLSVARGVALPRALIDRGVLTERALEEDLARSQGFALEQVVASPELSLRLPPSMCRRLGAVPVRYDSSTNAAEIAAIDSLDPHVASEFAFHLGLDVRVVRATMSAIEAAIRRLELGDGEGGGGRVRRRTPAFPHGAPRSTAPPPPLEDIPIPLVRRVGGPLVDRDRDANSFSPPASSVRVTERRAITPPSMLRHEPRLLTEATTVEPAPPVSFPSSPPARMLEVQTAYVPPPPTPPALPPETVVPDVDGWSPASETFQAGFAAALDANPSEPARPPSEHPPPSYEPRSRTDPMELAPMPPHEVANGVDVHDAPETVAEPDFRESAELVTDGDEHEPPSPDRVLELALDQLSAAETRDELVGGLVESASQLARRVAIFVVRKDGYHGWACNAAFGDVASLRGVTIPHTVPNVLATATAAGFYLGPVPSTPGHIGLLAVMGHAGPEVAVHVARVSGKPAMLVLAEGLDDPMRATRALGEMMRVAGLTLGRILALR